MNDNSNNGTPGRIDDAGSVISGSPRRQLTALQKVGVAGLVLVVFLAFIWIGQLNKATREVKQPEAVQSTGGPRRCSPCRSCRARAAPAWRWRVPRT